MRRPAEYPYFEDVSQKHLKGAIYDNSPKGEPVTQLMFEKNPKKLNIEDDGRTMVSDEIAGSDTR